MTPEHANKVLWRPASRSKAEPALYLDGVIYLTRGDFDLSFRLDPSDQLTIVGNSPNLAGT